MSSHWRPPYLVSAIWGCAAYECMFLRSDLQVFTARAFLLKFRVWFRVAYFFSGEILVNDGSMVFKTLKLISKQCSIYQIHATAVFSGFLLEITCVNHLSHVLTVSQKYHHLKVWGWNRAEWTGDKESPKEKLLCCCAVSSGKGEVT